MSDLIPSVVAPSPLEVANLLRSENIYSNDKELTMFSELISNAMVERSRLFESLSGGKKDVYGECDLPNISTVFNANELNEIYEREGIANRIVEVLPKETWQVHPEVYEDEDNDEVTEWEEAVEELTSEISGEPTYHDGGKLSRLWNYLLKLDIISGIGRYGILFLGIAGDTDFSQPAKGKKKKLSFLRVLPEGQAQITRVNNDPAHPRFGLPEEYLLTFTNPEDSIAAIGSHLLSTNVHWSRVIHVCDNPGATEFLGRSRLKAQWNFVLGLRKIYCGAPEMYWKAALPGLSFETHPQLGGDVKIDAPGLRNMYQKYSNGLEKALFLSGMSAKTISPAVSDPSPFVNCLLEAVSITGGYPMRIFKGSERGELASSQDDEAWNDRIVERQMDHVIPRIIAPFFDRMINLKILPEPKDGYKIHWPTIRSQSPSEKAVISGQLTTAITGYVGGNGATLMAPIDFLTRILFFTKEEAEQIIETAEAELAAAEEKAAENENMPPLDSPPPMAPGQTMTPEVPPGEIPPGAPPEAPAIEGLE